MAFGNYRHSLEQFYDYNWNYASGRMSGAGAHMDFAVTAAGVDDLEGAIQQTHNAFDHVLETHAALFYQPYYEYPRYWIFDLFEIIDTRFLALEAAEPAELTMAAILQCMLTATAAEIKYFVGIVDGYRQAVWNQPFDSEFFAALARGFELWG